MSPDKGKVPSAIHSTLVGKLQTDGEDGTDNMFVGLPTNAMLIAWSVHCFTLECEKHTEFTWTSKHDYTRKTSGTKWEWFGTMVFKTNHFFIVQYATALF